MSAYIVVAYDAAVIDDFHGEKYYCRRPAWRRGRMSTKILSLSSSKSIIGSSKNQSDVQGRAPSPGASNQKCSSISGIHQSSALTGMKSLKLSRGS